MSPTDRVTEHVNAFLQSQEEGLPFYIGEGLADEEIREVWDVIGMLSLADFDLIWCREIPTPKFEDDPVAMRLGLTPFPEWAEGGSWPEINDEFYRQYRAKLRAEWVDKIKGKTVSHIARLIVPEPEDDE